MPVLEKLTMERKRLYSVEDIVKLPLHPDLKSSKFVATKVPTVIFNSVLFVIGQGKTGHVGTFSVTRKTNLKYFLLAYGHARFNCITRVVI